MKEIFRDSPVRELPRASYWKTIRESRIPVVVNFKEFRTPSLLFWNVYYNTACGYIDKNILD